MHYDVEFFLTGDMKFLQLVKGFQGATSVFSFPLCVNPKTLKRGSEGVIPVGGFRCCCNLNEEEDQPIAPTGWVLEPCVRKLYPVSFATKLIRTFFWDSTAKHL